MTDRRNIIRSVFGGEEMDNYFTELIRELILNNTNQSNITEPIPTTNRQPNYTIPENTNRYFNSENEAFYITRAVREMMSEYNANIRSYQDNVRSGLEILDSLEHHASVHRRNVFERQTHAASQNTPPIYTNTFRNVPPATSTRPSIIPRNTAPVRNARYSNVWSRQYSYPGVVPGTETVFNRTIRATIPTNLHDVVVRPTYEEVLQATTDVMYTRATNNLNTNCPITLDEFREGDLLTQIRHCGHLFTQPAIQNWFSRNVRCPVCRYDIRTRRPNTSSSDISGNRASRTTDISGNNQETDPSNDSDSETTENVVESDEDEPDTNELQNINSTSREDMDNLMNDFMNEVTNTIQTYVNNIDSSNSYYVEPDLVNANIYTFEIPLNYYIDTSGTNL